MAHLKARFSIYMKAVLPKQNLVNTNNSKEITFPLEGFDAWLEKLDKSNTTQKKFKDKFNPGPDPDPNILTDELVAVLVVSETAKIVQLGPSSNHETLLSHLEDVLTNNVIRLLVILEDPSPSVARIFGPFFGIPASVFALHIESPLDHLQGDVRVPLGEDPSHHFVLNYQQRHDWVIKEKNPGLEPTLD